MSNQKIETSVHCLCCQVNQSDPTHPITPICVEQAGMRTARFRGNFAFPMIGSLANCPLFTSGNRHPHFPREASIPLDILRQIPELVRAHAQRQLATDQGVQVGLLSEEHMLEVLTRHSLLSQLVTNIEYSPPLSAADHKGFDFVVKLNPVVATALGLTHIKIQVKTLPNHFVYYVKEKLIPKIIEGKLKGSSHLPVIEEGLVVVSTGGGETADATIMSAIIHQLVFYTRITGGEAKVQVLIDALNQIDTQIFSIYDGQIPLVLMRDYDPLLEYLEFLENLWQAQGIEGLTTYYETEIKGRGKNDDTSHRSPQSVHQPIVNRNIPEATANTNTDEIRRRNRPPVEGGSKGDRRPRDRRNFVRPNPAQSTF